MKTMLAINIIFSVFLSMTMATMANFVVELLKSNVPAQQWVFFVAFFVVLRLKLFFDDLKYCISTDRKSLKFKWEFSAGMLFWFLWIADAAILPIRYMGACLILSGTILVGTLILILFSNEPNKLSFINFNILYILLLASSAFLSHAFPVLSILSMLGAVLGVIWDFKRNASLDVFESP
jgi:hypothetical protein